MGDFTAVTPHIIAREALIALEDNTVLSSLVHRDFAKEFQKVGSTVSIRKPVTMVAASVSDTVNEVTPTESSVDIVLNEHIDITFNVTTTDLSLSVTDFSEQLIAPAMRGHAEYLDGQLADLYKDIAGHYRVTTTHAAGDIAELRAVMSVLQCPLQDRRLVMHPVTEVGYIKLDAFLNAHKRGDGGRALREAEMGRVMGFDCYMDQNMKTHAAGLEAADSTGAIVGAGASAGTACSVDGLLNSSTIFIYDVFKFTGYDQWFVVNAAATSSSGGEATITDFSPPLNSVIADDTVCTILHTHRANLAFHKNCFALATAPLAPPIGGAAAAVVNYKGISARVVYDYTMMTKKNLISIDLLYGRKTLDRSLGARLADEN